MLASARQGFQKRLRSFPNSPSEPGARSPRSQIPVAADCVSRFPRLLAPNAGLRSNLAVLCLVKGAFTQRGMAFEYRDAAGSSKPGVSTRSLRKLSRTSLRASEVGRVEVDTATWSL